MYTCMMLCILNVRIIVVCVSRWVCGIILINNQVDYRDEPCHVIINVFKYHIKCFHFLIFFFVASRICPMGCVAGWSEIWLFPLSFMQNMLANQYYFNRIQHSQIKKLKMRLTSKNISTVIFNLKAISGADQNLFRWCKL